MPEERPSSIAYALFGIVTVVVVGYFASNPLAAPLKTGLTFDSLLGALGGLFVLVLLIERLTEVVVALHREPGPEALKFEADAATDAETKLTKK